MIEGERKQRNEGVLEEWLKRVGAWGGGKEKGWVSDLLILLFLEDARRHKNTDIPYQ